MTQTRYYQIGQLLKQICAALSISPARVLARCGLPRDYLENQGRGVDARTWFSVAPAMAQETDDPDFPLTLGRGAARGPIQPALLAFSSSPDIATGLKRLKLFKPLVAPVTLNLDEDADSFSINLQASERGMAVPGVVSATENVFFLELARNFAAHPIQPLAVTLPDMTYATDAYRTFVGGPDCQGTDTSFTLSMEDACRPLISADTDFDNLIEKELLARLDLNRAVPATKD